MALPRLLKGPALAAACLLCSVFGKVPAPQNVSIHSVNLRHILRWEPPIYQGGNLTYTVQYIRSSCIRRFHANHSKAVDSPVSVEFRDQCQYPASSTEDAGDESDVMCHYGFQDECRRTVQTECVFHPLLYGSFCLRVRAELENSTSSWESIYFEPLKQTTIGPPPDVTVKSRAGFLDVNFACPMYEFENICLKEIYGVWMYTVRYWKKGTNSQAETVETKQTYAILSDLEPWTTYCLQVHASIPNFSNTGEPSPVVCEQTSDDGHVPWWIETVAFLLSMGVVAATLTACFFVYARLYKVTRYVFHPPCSFPPHLKEFLSQQSYNAPFPPMKPNEEEHEICNKVTVISEDSGNCTTSCASMIGYPAEEELA